MSKKSKGINAERDLIHKFWKNKWCAVRIAGSGSMKYPSADVLASNKLRRLAIECKVTKEKKKYFLDLEIEQLKSFSYYFGAEPWIAVKFGKEPWLFINIEDLVKTNKGFAVTLDNARRRGLLFEEII